jgi:hypothetical protein
MSTLIVSAILALSFLITAALLVVFQTWVRLNAPSPSAAANLRRCLWVALVSAVWWPWVVLSQWHAHGAFWNIWTSLKDQRLFLIGVSPTLWVVGCTSVVQPWAYSLRTWLFGANLLAIGLFYGLFVGTVAWPGNLITYQWLFWSALGFGMSLRQVFHSKPGQSWVNSSTPIGNRMSNDHASSTL